jgi:dihydrofolate synthase/folylpolyglutamate synthase
MISEETFVNLEQQVCEAAQGLDEMPTFFERMTAMAFLAFANEGVEIAVLEVGLGGRLDATNVVMPLACGITRIDLDHQHVLGDTVEAIAREKAGIIKPGVPVVASSQLNGVHMVLEECAARHAAPLFRVGRDVQIERLPHGIGIYQGNKEIMSPAKPALRGIHQFDNLAVAVAMLEQAKLVNDIDVRKRGIENAKWPGRFEVFDCADKAGCIVLDGAHNACGTEALIDSLAADSQFRGQACHLLFGVTKGHDALPILRILREKLKIATLVLTQSRSPRSVEAALLADIANEAGFTQMEVEPNVRKALALVQEKASIDRQGGSGFALITGSLYLVGQVRAMLAAMPEDPDFPQY